MMSRLSIPSRSQGSTRTWSVYLGSRLRKMEALNGEDCSGGDRYLSAATSQDKDQRGMKTMRIIGSHIR